jgi:hypothetical protein
MYWQGLDPRLWVQSTKVIGILVVILGLVAGGFYLHHSGYKDGYKTAQTEGELELARFKESIRTLLDAQMKAQQAYEAAVESRVTQIQKDKEDEVKALSDRYNALVNSVRNRAPRNPSPSTGQDSAVGTSDGSGARCTGRELSREDAEFLAREAYRADILRKALEACRKSYEALVNTNKKE